MRCFVSSRRKKVERYQFVLVEFVCKMSFNRIWRQTAILSLSCLGEGAVFDWGVPSFSTITVSYHLSVLYSGNLSLSRL